MKKIICVVTLFIWTAAARGQTTGIRAQIVNRTESARQVTVVDLSPHFVTAIRVPEPVTSVAVGDPARFQAEHSDHEPELVFVKAVTTRPAETNLLIATAKGHAICLLLESKGDTPQSSTDVLVNYRPDRSFIIEPSTASESVAETVPVETSAVETSATDPVSPMNSGTLPTPAPIQSSQGTIANSADGQWSVLDSLLQQQKRAPLPKLYGEHPTTAIGSGERIRAGVSEVIDGGEDVIVLFSVVNPQRHTILLMPPQVQLGGETRHGKLIKHSRWTNAEQLAVIAYRLSRRRLGPGERADGVVVFERPPYKQSNETLFLQMAEAGAVDEPALVPIGFGVSTSQEDHHARRSSER
jgi:hypothetical protein